MKNLSKREIVNLYGDDGIQYRSQNMWNDSLTSEIPEEIKMENNNSKEIIELGRKHGKEDLAMNAVVAGQSYEDFRNELLDNVSNDKPLDLARGEGMDAKSFDLNKAFREFVDGKQISGLEGEWQQELKRSRPLSTDSSFYIPSSRALNSSAPLSSLNVQDVVASGEVSEQWENLGMRMYTIEDGRARVPAEETLAAASAVDFDGSNSASDVAPAITGVDLTASSLVAYSTVTRNLINRQSVDVEAYLGNSLRRSIGLGIEDQVYGGNGSHPNFQGILNASVNQETYSSAPDYADIRNCVQHVMDDGYSTNNAKWIVTPAFFNSLSAISKDSGSGNFLINPMKDENNPYVRGEMLGYPLMVSSKLSSGHAIFGSFDSYAFAMFNGLEVAVDTTDFAKQIMGVMAIQDCAGAVLQPKAFTELLSA